MKKTVLVVDDESDIRRSLRTALEGDGYAVREAGDAAEARRSLDKSLPDLLILDVRMPGEDGFTFCRKLREEPAHRALPILFLTSRGQESNKVLGLELGADDYVAKPFSVPELLARVKAVIRRRSGDLEADVLEEGPVRLDVAGKSVRVEGDAVKLTAKEFELLHLLLRKKGRVLSRNYLMESIWGRAYEQSTRTIDQHVYKLRKALGDEGDRIVSVGTAGYKWEEG
jgi:DNA-binding response OmpR family regulator